MSKVVAVIPAAGKGSRLGFPVPIPKIFAPITPTVSPWTILKGVLAPLVEHIEIVLAPGVAAVYSDALQGIAGGIGISMQSEPRGMGDAVFCADWHDADTIVVVWGDQIGINSKTVEEALQEHGPVWCDQCRDEHVADHRVIIPMVRQLKPYVEYRFDAFGYLSQVLSTRDGDETHENGWSDVGVFVLSTYGLRKAWLDYQGYEAIIGHTPEFLPFLVYLTDSRWDVCPMTIDEVDEARGLNTPEDLEWARERFGK